MLEEQLQVVLGNWGEGPFSFAGEHYAPRELDARPKPVQRPHPPLIMGGSGGRRSLALAARYADEYNSPYPTLDDVRARVDAIAEACAGTGREPLPFSIMTAVVTAETDAALRARVRWLAERIGADAATLLSDPPPAWIIATWDEATERLQALRDAGVARVMCQHLLHEDLDAVAQIGERLAPAVA